MSDRTKSYLMLTAFILYFICCLYWMRRMLIQSEREDILFNEALELNKKLAVKYGLTEMKVVKDEPQS